MLMRLFFLSPAFILFMGCNNAHHTTFDLEGHRGCRGIMPENTIPAMLKAIDLNVNTLEMDVVITADKKVLVSHEPFFNHEITTLPTGDTIAAKDEWNYNIYHMSYDSVKLYDVGLKPHPRFPEQKKLKVTKPLLADLIDSVEAYCIKINHPEVHYNIEIKSLDSTDNLYHPSPGEFAELLMKVIIGKKINDRVIIQSFDKRSLQVMRKNYPTMKLSFLIDERDTISLKQYRQLLGFKPDIISPDYSLLNPQIIDALHDQDILVIPWTVDDLETARKLYKWGVDGIITDFPDRISINTL